MHFSFLAVNENANENEIPFSAEKHNIFGPTQEIFGTKTKNKTKMKIHFRPKTKKNENDQNENEYRSAWMAWPDWLWPPQILRQIYANDPTNSVKALMGKSITSTDLLTSNSPSIFQPFIWPLKASGYLGEGCRASRQPADTSSLPNFCNAHEMEKISSVRHGQSPGG